jgi:shikimate dehydrogenase
MSGDVYQMEQLASRSELDRGFTKPALLSVIGAPVAHSASPSMHQPALDAIGVNGRYIKLEVPVGRVAEALQKLADLGFHGANITVPHKFAALDACHEVDTAAQQIGAVNTVRFRDGEIHGWNTDGPGFAAAIREEFDVSLQGKRVMIVGAGGGAGQAIATQCAMSEVSWLVLANRTLEKVLILRDSLCKRYPKLRCECLKLDDDQLAGVARQCQLLVNTSSLGLRADDDAPIGVECFNEHQMVYDTIYKPPLTAFLRHGLMNKASVANGFSMLLHQGVLAFDLWYPGLAPLEIMRKGLGRVR